VQSVSRTLHPLLLSHIEKWESCTLCPIHCLRPRPVFYRGSLPATILYLGDAPDDSAASTGLPFADPITRPILDAYTPSGTSWAVTYLTVCGGQARPPSTPEITACWTRLLDFVELCQPKIICTIGKTADGQYLRKMNEVISKLKRRPHCIRVNSPIYVAQAKDQDLELKKIQNMVNACLEKLHETFPNKSSSSMLR
jgi:uracil-DNA glycosylase family 4